MPPVPIWLIDIIDILLVAWGLYRILVLIRGTRAVSLLRGVALLLVVTAASGWLGLRTVNWVLDRVLTALLVALPVIFYPELRRALEHLGRGELFGSAEGGPFAGWLSWRNPRSASWQALVDVLVRATAELSRRRIGALIAIEQDVGLGEYIETGVDLEAEPSVELLVTLFTPSTPLHDGAVILRSGRVWAAACFLPLAQPEYLTRKMGSRHRAALGLSEQSDALVLVVSEETGQISVARNGRMTWDISEEALRQWLSEAGRTRPVQARNRRRRVPRSPHSGDG